MNTLALEVAEPGLPRLLGLGLLAAALFSVTFVLNRAMSLDGGSWVWSASLRYLDMAVLLAAWVGLRRGPTHLAAVLRAFWRRLAFWLAAGSVGFGLFYGCICYAAGHAPGWIVAGTWQATVLATPLVLRAFGARVPLRGVAFAAIIVLGIVLLNAQLLAAGLPWPQLLRGVLPVLVAAVAYPVGNQLLNRARHAGGAEAALLADPAIAVLLMTLGALPGFAGLALVAAPPPPGLGQIVSTGVVALVAGVFATTLFLHARNMTEDPLRIAAVDASQAGEVGFALAGEMLFLGGAAPGWAGWAGLLAVMLGLAGFALQGTRRRAR